MNEQNPYKPILSEPATPLTRIRGLRRFVVLNSVIFSIPVLCAFAAYLVLEANGLWCWIILFKAVPKPGNGGSGRWPEFRVYVLMDDPTIEPKDPNGFLKDK